MKTIAYSSLVSRFAKIKKLDFWIAEDCFAEIIYELRECKTLNQALLILADYSLSSKWLCYIWQEGFSR